MTDLRAALADLDEQLGQLTRQRDELERLVASVGAGGSLSPLPVALARFYDHLEMSSDDERARHEIPREREFNRLAFYRGDLPAEVELLFWNLTDADLRESMKGYESIAERTRGTQPLSDEWIETFAASTVERIRRQLGTALPQVARALDAHAATRAVDLYVRIGPDRERRLRRAIGEALLAALADARTR